MDTHIRKNDPNTPNHNYTEREKERKRLEREREGIGRVASPHLFHVPASIYTLPPRAFPFINPSSLRTFLSFARVAI